MNKNIFSKFLVDNHLDDDQQVLSQLKREQTVKDLTQKLSNLPLSPTVPISPNDKTCVGDMSGLISKAKEGLIKSKSKNDLPRSPSAGELGKKPEPKKSETDIQWEELVNSFDRELKLCDLDFTDLQDDEDDHSVIQNFSGMKIPPPPPPMAIPMIPGMNHMGPGPIAPPAMPKMMPMLNGMSNGIDKSAMNGGDTIKKNKKTVSCFAKKLAGKTKNMFFIFRLNYFGKKSEKISFQMVLVLQYGMICHQLI